MVNTHIHTHPKYWLLTGSVLTLLAGLLGFASAIATVLPCLGENDEALSAFAQWGCNAGDAYWLYVGPMIVLPVAVLAFATARTRAVASYRPLLWSSGLTLVALIAMPFVLNAMPGAAA